MTDHTPSGQQAVEILPCPFCGRPVFEKRRENNPYAKCVTEGCFGARLQVVSLDDPQQVLEWNTRSVPTAPSTAAADTARLDFLDRCNARLNAKSGTSYHWTLILNHNVSRLMLGHFEVDLNDAEARGLPSCRDAIDEKMRECSTVVSAPAPSTAAGETQDIRRRAGRGGERVTERWEPMETAPMDGTVIQLLQGGEVFAGFAGDDPDHPWKFLDRKGRNAFVNAFHHKFSPRWWRPLGVPVREAALRAAQEGTSNG